MRSPLMSWSRAAALICAACCAPSAQAAVVSVERSFNYLNAPGMAVLRFSYDDSTVGSLVQARDLLSFELSAPRHAGTPTITLDFMKASRTWEIHERYGIDMPLQGYQMYFAFDPVAMRLVQSPAAGDEGLPATFLFASSKDNIYLHYAQSGLRNLGNGQLGIGQMIMHFPDLATPFFSFTDVVAMADLGASPYTVTRATPQAPIAPVPLPAAGLLLIAGLGALSLCGRRAGAKRKAA